MRSATRKLSDATAPRKKKYTYQEPLAIARMLVPLQVRPKESAEGISSSKESNFSWTALLSADSIELPSTID